MSRNKPGTDRLRNLSEPEFIEFAQRLGNLLVDNKWYRNMFLKGLEVESRSPGLLELLQEKISKTIELPSPPMDKELATRFTGAIKRRRRDEIVSLLVSDFRKSAPTQEIADTMLKMGQPRLWRKGLLQAADRLKGAPGRPRDLEPKDYSKLASFADMDLAPLIQKVLDAQHEGTHRSIREILDFWSKDHCKASAFLLRNLPRFERVVSDPKLAERGKKRGTRAHLLAAAMAGAGHGLKPSTSVARVSEGRRLLKHKAST